ncbi:glycine zipper domain-containing protein [Kordiimonas gwangyangensis]|uniref:glycine zipper domain-containing protein n=1 Tax=Kordiimonas gwangyangensis TaxID=288022 RepID=UPI0003A8E12B|nr:glycine zipper domain-containing protein [Kordiimonas gwangyangensis]
MMKTKSRLVALALPLALMTTACSQNMSPHSYEGRAVGEARRVERGVVESYRWVEIRGENSGVGTAVGVGVGAAAGSTVGNSGAENIIGAIGGALLGGLIGNSVDKSSSKSSGFEYLIRTESGALISIVQEDRHPFADGTPVVVVFARDRSRVILDHSAYEDNRGVETSSRDTRYRDVPPMEPFDEDDVIEPKGN